MIRVFRGKRVAWRLGCDGREHGSVSRAWFRFDDMEFGEFGGTLITLGLLSGTFWGHLGLES